MPSYFFDATQGAHEQITSLYDFVWPTGVAMWNLRWQVQGFVQVRPDASEAQLSGRFSEGADIHGANLRRACIEHTWEDQKESFARVLLYNCFAIYEGWIAELLEDLGAHTKAREKGLQFATGNPGNPSAADVINELTSTESAEMKSFFYLPLKRNPKYNFSNLANLLICYRYFKELRNSLMHSGGAATQRTVDAYTGYAAIISPSDLGMSELPEHQPVVLGLRPTLSLRGVVGLSEVMLRLLVTLDAELSRSKRSESSFEKRWRQKYPKRLQSLSANVKKRAKTISKMVEAAGFPKPEHPATLADFLKAKNLVWF